MLISFPMLVLAALFVGLGAALGAAVLRLRARAQREIEQGRTIATLSADLDGVRVVLHDYIQQREADEEVLRASEERYRLLVDNLSTIVFQVDGEGRWSFLNPAWSTVLGWPVDETLGRSTLEHVPEEDHSRFRVLQEEFFAGERATGDLLIRLRNSTGGLCWLEVRAMPLRGDSGEVTGISGTMNDVTKRVETEQALGRQQALYRLLADNYSDVVALFDDEGRLSYVSPSAQAVLGYTPEQLMEMDLSSFVTDHDRPLIDDAAQAVSEGCPATEVLRFQRRDAQWIWLDVAAARVIDPALGVVSYRVTARDVTERRQSSLALEESEAKYRMLAESIDDIVSLIELDGTAVYYSASTAKVIGFAPFELEGRDAFAIMHPDDRGRIAGDVHMAVLRGETPLFEWRCQCRDGSYMWMETHTTLVHDARGIPDRMLSVTRDIEKRKRTEEALRQSEERTRALIARAAYGIFRATRAGRFLDVNPALVSMLGYESADELMRVDIPRTIYVDPSERERWIQAIEGERIADPIELTWRKRDGSTIAVRLSPRAARDAHGELLWLEGIVENITERHRRELMVRRGERMASLGHTLAGVAHELNNPLAAVSGFAQILLKTDVPAEDRTALETIHHEAKRAAKIVKDLLTFSRRQEARERLRVDLNGIVSYIVETQRYSIETRGIACAIELSTDSAAILADAAQLEQVVLNLIVNARQALEEMVDESAPRTRGDDWTPTVTARTMVRGAEVLLQIEDNGPGIPAANLSRIWDPFWTTKEEGEGTGLGLSVVHGIVEAHGGSIEVDSRVGAGTRFTVSFPYDEGDDTDAGDATLRGEARVAAAHAAEYPLDILVIDDEKVIVGLLMRYFSSRGHAVVAAMDGAEALRLAHQSRFDVVICDLRMPGMDGAEVIQRLTEMPSCETARFILSTGDTASPLVRARIDGLPLSAVVEKPYEVETLRRIVEDGARERRGGSIALVE